ncbi:MAG: glycosyltransferase [Phycisphaeraceae bacterium]|nr:glycosyltransferase [Phycisphaeraceae bacterium]
MKHGSRLVVLPTMEAFVDARGGIVLTGKFDSGMRQYAGLWQGPVTAVMQPTNKASSNLDPIEVDPAKLPYKLVLANYPSGELESHLREGDVVMAGLCWQQNHISALCRKIGVPCVYVTEYALKTRLQQVAASVRNPLKRLRKAMWHRSQERRHIAAMRLADGLQANGMPTYEDYRRLVPHPMVYFDNRVDSATMADAQAVQQRTQSLHTGRPLRLFFTGRFIAIKGADHLPLVADHLRRLNVPFELTLCGGGDLEPAMREQVRRLNLEKQVIFAGNLDFHTELLPRVKSEADLFVCCHRQGDPSCTYVETLACGVPIAGYDNQAWSGMVKHSRCGWMTPMDKPRKLAELIAGLSQNRAAIVEMSQAALRFARQHSFESTMKNRMDHLRLVMESKAGAPSALPLTEVMA